ncbi:MAG: S24 family peptidase [Polaribacter sp.]
MRDFSVLKQRIIQFIDYKKVSKYEFYQKTGISNGVLSQKTGMSEENIFKFLSYYSDVNPVWLLTGKGDITKQNVLQSVKECSHIPTIVTVDSLKKDNVVFVSVKATEGYLNGYENPEYIKKLPSYRLPNLKQGIFRMFQIDGNSMYPTLDNTTYVVGEWVVNWENEIKDDEVYIIVSLKEGVVIKRVLNRLKKYNFIYCKSDNRKEYPSFSVKQEDIVEVWSVKMSLTSKLPNPADIHDRMNDIEAELFQLKNQLKLL